MDHTDSLSLRSARKASGLTQAQLGRRLGRTQGQVSGYETGASAMPADVLHRACEVLDLSDADCRRLLRWAAQSRTAQEAA